MPRAADDAHLLLELVRQLLLKELRQLVIHSLQLAGTVKSVIHSLQLAGAASDASSR